MTAAQQTRQGEWDTEGGGGCKARDMASAVTINCEICFQNF